MARTKLKLPDKIHFTTELSIRVTDLNYGGHVGNDKIVGMLHDTRVLFLNSLGYKDELSLEGLGLIQADLSVVYVSELFLGDTLIIHLGLEDFNKYGFDIIYQLISKHENKEIARAKTGMVFFNYVSRKVASVPDGFLKKIQTLNPE